MIWTKLSSDFGRKCRHDYGSAREFGAHWLGCLHLDWWCARSNPSNVLGGGWCMVTTDDIFVQKYGQVVATSARNPGFMPSEPDYSFVQFTNGTRDVTGPKRPNARLSRITIAPHHELGNELGTNQYESGTMRSTGVWKSLSYSGTCAGEPGSLHTVGEVSHMSDSSPTVLVSTAR